MGTLSLMPMPLPSFLQVLAYGHPLSDAYAPASFLQVLAYYLRTPSLPALVPIRHVSQFFTATDGSDGRSLKRRLRPAMAAASGSMAAGGGLLVQRPLPPSNLFFVAKALEACDKPAPPPLQPQQGHAPSSAFTSRPHHDPYHDPYAQQPPGPQPLAIKGARGAFDVGPRAPNATCSLHRLSRGPHPQRQKLQQRSPRSAAKSEASDKSYSTADGSVAPAVEAATEGDDASAASAAAVVSAAAEEEQLAASAVADHVDMLASRLRTLLLSSPAPSRPCLGAACVN